MAARLNGMLNPEAPAEIFQGGASDLSIIYWINQNLTAATRILLRSLNQKFKWFCSKNVAIRAAC